eukprot:608083-Prymnesium_polylepis.1
MHTHATATQIWQVREHGVDTESLGIGVPGTPGARLASAADVAAWSDKLQATLAANPNATEPTDPHAACSSTHGPVRGLLLASARAPAWGEEEREETPKDAA